MKGAHPHDFATIIDRSGVAMRAGTHLRHAAARALGVSATCRALFALYNTSEEVDCLVQALTKAHGVFRMNSGANLPCRSQSSRVCDAAGRRMRRNGIGPAAASAA